MPFPAEVVTPEQALVSEPATAVVLRTTEGEMTVLDGHTALVAVVEPGEVRIERSEGDPLRLAVHGGFLRVDTSPGAADEPADDAAETAPGSGASGSATPGPGGTERPMAGLSTRVTLLAGVAELAGEIDVERAQRARDEAEARAGELRSQGARLAAAGPSGGEGAEPGSAGSEADVALSEAERALARARLRLEVAGAG